MSTCPLASPDRPAIEAVLFDLDDTLYRIEEIPQRVRENIEGESSLFLSRSLFFSRLDLDHLNFFPFFLLLLLRSHHPIIFLPFSLYHLGSQLSWSTGSRSIPTSSLSW